MCKIIIGITFAVLILEAIWDWRKKEVPVLLLMAMSGIAVLSMLCHEVKFYWRVGGAIIGLIFILVSWLSKEAIGYGDSWTILNLGIILGFYKIIEIVLWAAFLAGISSLFLLWKRKWKRKNSLPFIPFLVASCLGVLLI